MDLARRNIEKIQRLEAANRKLPQVSIETIENIIGSMYTRRITIPAGTVITSRVYKRSYVDIMISGDITITDSNGTYRLTGYNVLEGTAGRKRAGYAHEPTEWITVHDLVDIRSDNPIDDISFETLAEYEAYRVNLAVAGYERFLQHQSGTDEVEQEGVADVIGEFYIGESPIHGKGVFASRRLTAGTKLGLAVVNTIPSTLSRYMNHSDYPNAIIQDDQVILVHPVDTGHEIVTNYNFTARHST